MFSIAMRVVLYSPLAMCALIVRQCPSFRSLARSLARRFASRARKAVLAAAPPSQSERVELCSSSELKQSVGPARTRECELLLSAASDSRVSTCAWKTRAGQLSVFGGPRRCIGTYALSACLAAGRLTCAPLSPAESRTQRPTGRPFH